VEADRVAEAAVVGGRADAAAPRADAAARTRASATSSAGGRS